MRRTLDGPDDADAALRFHTASRMLFSELADDEDLAVVCVEHQKFIPCRTCMYVEPASVPYSNDPQAVDKVRQYQNQR